MQTPPHSFHCFLFPFKWEHLFNDQENRAFSHRVDLDEFERKLELNQPKNPWKRKVFEVNYALAYNEYNYFYDFARDVIYDRGDGEAATQDLDEKSLVRHYEYVLPVAKLNTIQNSYYKIVCNAGNWEKYVEVTYWLKIRNIFLDLYETGVGVLSYHLLNECHADPEDILNINQYGRRAFVGGFQLSRYPSKTIRTDGEEKFVDLAKSITLHFADGSRITEDFGESSIIKNYESQPFILPKIITQILGGTEHENRLTTNWNANATETSGNQNRIWISPSIDDRMFVVSWYRCDTKTHLKSLNLKSTPFQGNDYGSFVEHSEFWYKYIYIDKNYGESYQNPTLQKQQTIRSTYDRWLNYGTLYGVSRYSFVMFCDLGAPDYLLAVFESMYLKMVEISLVQRATVLRFSDEVQYVSSMKKESESSKVNYLRELYRYHIRFINKIDFQEVTAQEQGIELYDKIQETMRIRPQVEYLDKEISRLHEYGLLLEEKKRSEKLDLITYVGLPIAVISLVLSIIGFLKDIIVEDKPEVTDDKLSKFNLYFYDWVWAYEFIGLILMVVSGYLLIMGIPKKVKFGNFLQLFTTRFFISRIILIIFFAAGLILVIASPFFKYIFK